jgi:tRNA pseudouridine38-40 synthase
MIAMKNIKLILEFDGTDFHGWQNQPEVRTVQGVLEGVASELFGEPVSVNGCCRTDSGVHAWGYVGSFRVDTNLDPRQIRGALSGRLPADVVVKSVAEVPTDFHARRDCIARRYLYRLTSEPTAVLRQFVAYTKYQLDVEKMAEGAARLVGRNDFTSFAPAALSEGVSTICDVVEAAFRRDGEVFSFDIKADRFLHHMVRNIVGTLIEVGRGRLRLEQIDEILRKKDRRAAGPTAPACGLFLMVAYYPEQDV